MAELVPQKMMDVTMSGDWPTFTCGCGKHTLGGKNWAFLKYPCDPKQKTDDYSKPELYFWCTSCGAYYEVTVKINQVRMEKVAQLAVDSGQVELVEEVDGVRWERMEKKGEHEATDS